ncbi:MAG: homocysteine S-methyltransferase family protein [Beijerinckiaceae bacterium]|nr:homocysteine S-methyltransferase family protein [Beijerinckiaceae bacterium]MCI0734782.1 homocysteine S-methyltransferase family protein [Beijerinckiaceae bacterium]
MSKYRTKLPQLSRGTFLSDGGMETTLIFHEGVELPHFASFVLLSNEDGRRRLRNYYIPYLSIARNHGAGFILDTPTWRANPDWGQKLGYGAGALAEVNKAAVDLMVELRDEFETSSTPCVISVAIGPRGDGYKAGQMNAFEAEAYHGAQIASAAESEADMVAAYTLTNADEAVGIARAARTYGIPCSISFTLETDGRLITGRPLRDAIESVDAATGGSVAYFMVNCAHPAHFEGIFDKGDWCSRILGVRANASMKSHAELDESGTLDEGDPEDLGRRYLLLKQTLPSMRIMGGCCGTGHRHLAAICEACI